MTHDRRPHQKLAISSILSGFKRHARGQFISACGTGKTRSCLWVKEDLDAQRTLVLVPSLALIDQYASEWREHQAPELRYATLCVCSDSTVGQADEDYDSIDLTPDDLKHDGFEVTSSPDRIAAFMRQAGRQVIFSTYQSSHLIEAAQDDASSDESVPPFDLAIADEAHRCAGKRDSVFATILYGDRIRASRRLFATATPKVQRKKSGDSGELEDVADMSNEAAFGKVFHRLTLGSAIREGILSDYRVYITEVSDNGLHESLTSNDDSAKVKRRHSVQVSMFKTIRELGLQRVVTFHNRVENAKLYAAELPQVAAAVAGGRRPAVTQETVDYVSGKMSAEVRKQKLETFRANGNGTCHIISNARCLSEGVDVPDIDGIVFVDPRGSEIDIVQALGRAIRKHDNKEFGSIIVPVFVGKGQTASEAIERSSFSHVVDVLNALRAHDMEFGATLDAMRQRQVNGKTIEGEADPFSKIIFDLKGVHGIDQVLKPLLLESLTDSFQDTLGRIKAFLDEHGHCRVPKGYKSQDGFNLNSRVGHLRTSKRAGTLPPERIAALDELGFEWEPFDADFLKGLGYLKAFKDEYGHFSVPRKFGYPDGFQLAYFVKANRQSKRAGTLPPERIAALDELGFEWEPFDAGFQKGLGYLKAFLDEHGHCLMPKGYKSPNGFQLAKWVIVNRMNKRAGTLPPERIAALDELGFEWEPFEADFLKGLGYLKAFKDEHGHCLVPKGYKSPDGFQLAVWVVNKRQSKRAGTLPPDRIATLDGLDFEWEPRKAEAEAIHKKTVVCIKAFKEQHGHCRIPVDYKSPDGFNLYNVITNMRSSRRNGTLTKTPEQIVELDSIGFVWEPMKQQPSQQVQPTISVPDLADRLKDEEQADDLPDLMAQHGCDLEESRVLIQAGSFDDALRLLEEATGELLRRNRP